MTEAFVNTHQVLAWSQVFGVDSGDTGAGALFFGVEKSAMAASPCFETLREL